MAFASKEKIRNLNLIQKQIISSGIVAFSVGISLGTEATFPPLHENKEERVREQRAESAHADQQDCWLCLVSVPVDYVLVDRRLNARNVKRVIETRIAKQERAAVQKVEETNWQLQQINVDDGKAEEDDMQVDGEEIPWGFARCNQRPESQADYHLQVEREILKNINNLPQRAVLNGQGGIE